MRKLILFLSLFCTLMFSSCNGALEDVNVRNIKQSEVIVYSGENANDKIITKALSYNTKKEEGYSIPVDGAYDVWYYIRIDGNIPGESEINKPANQYFPQTASGGTVVDNLNHGTVRADADWGSSKSKNFPKYIYDGTGVKVQDAIISEPTLDDMFTCNKSGSKYDLSGYIDHKDELHFLWYTCKQQTKDHIWHIDGVLTSKDRTNISETIYGANVEVDIHQQEHKDWNEIKTSIHLRDSVDVEVLLPINYAAQADDLVIRSGVDYEYIIEHMTPEIEIDDETYVLDVEISHEAAGIRITVHAPKEALVAARRKNDDGITFEIHNYVSNNIPTSDIWEDLKRSTAITIPKKEILNGKVSSAYNSEIIYL